MKSRKQTLSLKSFEAIKTLLESKSISFPEAPPPPIPDPQPEERPDPESEKRLFREAMKDVTPVARKNIVERAIPVPHALKSSDREETEPLVKLKDLVQHGLGFEIADTPEYIEGTLYHVNPEVASRLHRGDYSIQAYVNLHGLNVSGAKDTLEKFLKWAVTTGKNGVLIIHGRGLSSPDEPRLKQKVVEWLTRGPWRKWVVAYASARSCDGGAGATYVLLRRLPATKRLRKSIKGHYRGGPVGAKRLAE